MVCIDFGTYGTSFAFAIANDTRVSIGTMWDAQPGSNFKIPSQSLYHVGGTSPIAIGLIAGIKYSMDGEAKNYVLLKDFKMALENNNDEIIDEVSKQKFKVVDVVGHYLAAILEKILFRVNAASIDSLFQIKFVITVPSIWSDQTMLKMRKALVRAHIISSANASEEDCIFVTDSEAASAYCMETVIFNTYIFLFVLLIDDRV